MNSYVTHPDYRAILAAVIDDPADDLPRLVLADFLDERDDKPAAARAELIRLQCEWSAASTRRDGTYHCANCKQGMSWATGPTPRCRGRWCRLLRRERDLLARHRTDWDDDVLACLFADGRRVVRTPASQGLFSCYGVGADFSFWQGSLHYSRGFVSRLTLPAAAFARYGATLMGAAPVERVTLSDR